MSKRTTGKSIFAVVLTAAALAASSALPARAASPAVPPDELFTNTYYANSAHTGAVVGVLEWGNCPGVVETSWGTRTAYLTETEQSC